MRSHPSYLRRGITNARFQYIHTFHRPPLQSDDFNVPGAIRAAPPDTVWIAGIDRDPFHGAGTARQWKLHKRIGSRIKPGEPVRFSFSNPDQIVFPVHVDSIDAG